MPHRNGEPNKEAAVTATSGEHIHATGKIDVKTYEPTTYDRPTVGPALVRIHVVEDFSGDIEGEGVAEFLQTARGEDEASFVGVERVSGRIGDKSGTFVLQDQGTLKGTAPLSPAPGSSFQDRARVSCKDCAARVASRRNSAKRPRSRSTTGSDESFRKVAIVTGAQGSEHALSP
jgi:Protein of unknown function (DUF3224)